MINILINLIAIVVLGIVQVSFLTTWLFPVNSLNLILSVIIFLTVIIDYKKGLWWAFGAGLFLELYSSLIFGITTLSLILVVVAVNFLFNNFFTNRSLYSLLIGLIGSIGYNLIMLGLKLLSLVFGFKVLFFNFDFWSDFFWQPVLNLIILIVIFFTYHISTNRLKNMFLFNPASYENKGKF